uniref:SFRICE_036188 n=1 Tax=Spodoptera frugiperda TaxID=7108 RepID=A0A2H1VGP2_SPOFR
MRNLRAFDQQKLQDPLTQYRLVGKNGCVVACSHPIKISQPKRDAWLTINDGKQNAVCNPVIFEWAQHNNHNGMPTDDNEMNIRETAQIIKAADYAFPGAKLTFIRLYGNRVAYCHKLGTIPDTVLLLRFFREAEKCPVVLYLSWESNLRPLVLQSHLQPLHQRGSRLTNTFEDISI